MSFAGTESVASDESFETFDSFDESESDIDNDDDWGKEEPAAKKETVKDDLKVLKDSEADSEGKVIKEEGKKTVKETKADKEEEESDEDEDFDDLDTPKEEKEEEEEETEEKPKSKLRMRMGGELYNVDSDATLPVKIDGQIQDIPVQELANSYSGKVAWDKKFTEIGKEKKALEAEKATVTKQSMELKNHVNAALAPLKAKDGNPMDSLLYLVEMSGDDPYAAYRRIMEANLDELGMLYDMSETERELFFHKKKDELYSNVAKKRQGRLQEEQNFNQSVQKVDSLRQAYNVSEDSYVEAAEELESIYEDSKLDVNKITHEAIVDYASLKPHIAVVKELIQPYEDNLSDGRYGEVVAELSKYLRDGKADKETINKILARNFSVEEDVKELNTKVYSKQSAKKPNKAVIKEVSTVESFDDWD